MARSNVVFTKLTSLPKPPAERAMRNTAERLRENTTEKSAVASP